MDSLSKTEGVKKDKETHKNIIDGTISSAIELLWKWMMCHCTVGFLAKKFRFLGSI